MSAAALLMLAALQTQAPRVAASIDRTEVLLGDAVTLTIVVETSGAAPVRIIDPPLVGLELQGTREATQVRIVGGTPQRTVERALRLVATRAGGATIGPVRVVRDGDSLETAAIAVQVLPAERTVPPALAPRVAALLSDLPGPPGDTAVAVEVLAVPEAVRLGDQLDLVTLAWFRRDVRQQLRTPPTLSPPSVEGAWSYQQTAPSGIVTSRRVGSRWYDLFVSHQVLFPLAAGRVRVGRATVTYAVPVTYSFLSRELQHEVQSESLVVAVSPQPRAGRPADYTGAAGADLDLTMTTSRTDLTSGAAATVAVTLTGRGNVALWPEPRMRWPDGIRVYPGDVTVTVRTDDGVIGGVKRFEYLVVADSAGTHRVPSPRLTYFDTDRVRYVELGSLGIELVAPAGVGSAAARVAPPPLRWLPRRTLAERARGWPPVVWLIVLGGPPALVMLAAVGARRGRRRGAAAGDAVAAPAQVSELERLDHAFRGALERVVTDAPHREGRALADALRAAGVDASLAAHAARVRDRVHGAVYGPAPPPDTAELEAEVREVLRGLEAALRPRRSTVPVAGPVIVALLAVAPVAPAQDAERLYAAGAWQPAADSFLARAGAHPAVAAHWYHAGNALYQLGEDGRALTAWIEAARRDPRAADIRRALRLVPRDPVTRTLVPIYPVTPMELTLFAGTAWLLGWLALLLPRRRGLAVTLLLCASLGTMGAWAMDAAYRGPVAITLGDQVPLRDAPYGPARAQRQLPRAIAVRIVRERDGWALVERGGGLGWVRRSEIARL